MLKQMTILATVLVASLAAFAAEWSWQMLPGDVGGAGDSVAAEIAPFRYGKAWAYAVEIDDGGVEALTVVQPLLAKYHFTDAPSGMTGGKKMPLVGGAGIMGHRPGGGNNTCLSWDDLRKLQDSGWGIINHSYFHAGRTWGEPPELLSPEQIRTDLFWNQTLVGMEIGDGRAPVHFIYPNGYQEYSKYLAEFGMLSGSRVAGSSTTDVYSSKMKFDDLNRNYLDEGSWTSGGVDDAMRSFPKAESLAGQFIIDFTHGIDKDPQSPNQKRWQKRLETIESTWGAAGRDDMWCAPTGEIVSYVTARKNAAVTVKAGRVTVSLPDNIPGTALTLKITGLPVGAKLQMPEGTTLYSKDGVAWLTTPVIGLAGTALPLPRVQRIYAGPVKSMTFDKPVKLAAVRLLQSGPPRAREQRRRLNVSNG